jgi:hypothetical protein
MGTHRKGFKRAGEWSGQDLFICTAHEEQTPEGYPCYYTSLDEEVMVAHVSMEHQITQTPATEQRVASEGGSS